MKIRTNRTRNQKGNALLELAVITPMLSLLIMGCVNFGLILTAMSQISQVCRNSNALVIRGVDLSQTTNQQLLIRTAAGLRMNISGTSNPDPNGKGVVYVTKVLRVGPNACSLGIANWDQKPSSCPNYGMYVIASRISIGNTTRWPSPSGSPATTLKSNGDLYDSDIATNTGNRATGYGPSGVVTLVNDQYTMVSEIYVDISNLNLFQMINTPIVFMRNLS